MLLEHGADVSSQGGEYGNALQAATYMGHSAIALFLLDHGADVNAQGGIFGDALAAARISGKEQTARLLIDYGAVLATRDHIDYREQDNESNPAAPKHDYEGEEEHGSTGESSEDEWASAQEHPDESTAL